MTHEPLTQQDIEKMRDAVKVGFDLHRVDQLQLIDEVARLHERLVAAENVIDIARTLGRRNSVGAWTEFWYALEAFDELQPESPPKPQ